MWDSFGEVGRAPIFHFRVALGITFWSPENHFWSPGHHFEKLLASFFDPGGVPGLSGEVPGVPGATQERFYKFWMEFSLNSTRFGICLGVIFVVFFVVFLMRFQKALRTPFS